jgi:hypothetical protein
MHIATGVAEPLADDPRGEPFDEGGAEGLVASLPPGVRSNL